MLRSVKNISLLRKLNVNIEVVLIKFRISINIIKYVRLYQAA